MGSGKTALTLKLCSALRDKMSLAVVTNDIFTREDAEFLTRNKALPPERITAVETGMVWYGFTRPRPRPRLVLLAMAGLLARAPIGSSLPLTLPISLPTPKNDDLCQRYATESSQVHGC